MRNESEGGEIWGIGELEEVFTCGLDIVFFLD